MKAILVGINWQNFNIGLNSQVNNENSFIQFQNRQGFVKNLGLRVNLNFDSIINFLSQNGKTSVLSNPKLMALNNQQAIISVGDTINYQVKESSKGTENGTTVSESYNNYSIFVGILLNILPEISDDGKIMLRINPSLSDFKYPEDNKRQKEPRTIAPDTIQKKLSSVVQVENSQTLILGGLISHDKSNEKNSINFLSKIPILGSLFKGEVLNSKTTEIVFIITPSIVDSVNAPSLKDLDLNIMSKIIPFREEIFHQINQILESQKAFIFLWGKSGGGKSVLLQRLAKKYNVDFINENFKDQSFLKEKIEFLISQGQSLIILDEVGMYHYAMLESIRIYSDSISFVLSSHKKLNTLKKSILKVV